MQRKGGFFGHTHLKIYWFWSEINPNDGFLNCQPPVLPPKINQQDGFLNSQPPDSPSRPSLSETNVSPVVLFITVTLAVVFLMSGLLHLLVRLLTKRTSSSENLEASGSDAHQGQLQQLFDLNDSGLDQASIDALPVFSYKEIVGLQGRFDCAVCLCEFSEMDELKLIPMCRHAFHVNCIDTWLLAHSTCPLCRGALSSPEFSIENPLFDSDDTMEDDECQGGVEFEAVATERIFPVRLGKFQKSNGSDGELADETGTSKLDSRRCYSTGSYQYVVADANLRVFTQGQSGRGTKLVKVTEQACDPGDVLEGRKIGSGARTDCYSISKIWLWSEKGQYASSSQAQSENPFSPYLRLKIDA